MAERSFEEELGRLVLAEVALLAGTAVVAGILAALGVLPRWPGVIHAVALPPLDLAFDLRVLVTEAPSYPVLAVGLVLSLTARTAALGILLGLMGNPGSLRARIGLAARFYLVALVPLGLGAGLQFSAAAALYHWFFWAGLAVVVLTVLLLAASPFEGVALDRPGLARGFGRAVLRGFRLGPVLAYIVALLVLGAAAEGAGEWGAIPLVLVSAFLTWAAATTLNRPPKRVRTRVPVASVLALLLMFPSVVSAGSEPGVESSVLFLIAGVDSSSGKGSLYLLDTGEIGFPCDRVFYYSYRGPGSGAPQGEARCPIRVHAPYDREDTQRPLGVLVDAFADQAAAVSEATGGRPIVVVTHSQGAWIAWRAVAGGLAPQVSHLVFLGGFPRQAAAYPPEGRDGPGRVGSDVLRVVSDFFRERGTATFDPDAALPREMLGTPGAVEALFAESLPSGVRALTISATLDAPVMPGGRTIAGVPDRAVDTIHVGLTESPSTVGAIRRFLAGEAVGGTTMWAWILDAVVPALGAPPL